MKKYIIALVYGIFGSLGFFCLFNWYIMISFNDAYKYPYLYPMCIVFGIISFIICITTLIINIKMIINYNQKILKTIILEISTITIIFIPLLFCWDYIFEYIGKMF